MSPRDLWIHAAPHVGGKYHWGSGRYAAWEDPDFTHENRVSAAEQVMENAGHGGREFHIPTATLKDADALGMDTWDLQRQHSAEAEKFVNGVLKENGYPLANKHHVRVMPEAWELREPGSGQAFTDRDHIGIAGNDTNALALLHETAHILHGKSEGDVDAHGPEFQRIVHGLYHNYIHPEAANIFSDITGLGGGT